MNCAVKDLVRKAVCPCGMATIYLSPRDAPFRIVVKVKKEWAYIYKGTKKVFECNSIFAEKHFYDIPNKKR